MLDPTKPALTRALLRADGLVDVLIPRGALIGFDPAEDRRRHTVTENGVVVVTALDDPLVGPITQEALRAEADADRSGPAPAA